MAVCCTASELAWTPRFQRSTQGGHPSFQKPGDVGNGGECLALLLVQVLSKALPTSPEPLPAPPAHHFPPGLYVTCVCLGLLLALPCAAPLSERRMSADYSREALGEKPGDEGAAERDSKHMPWS